MNGTVERKDVGDGKYEERWRRRKTVVDRRAVAGQKTRMGSLIMGPGDEDISHGGRANSVYMQEDGKEVHRGKDGIRELRPPWKGDFGSGRYCGHQCLQQSYGGVGIPQKMHREDVRCESSRP